MRKVRAVVFFFVLGAAGMAVWHLVAQWQEAGAFWALPFIYKRSELSPLLPKVKYSSICRNTFFYFGKVQKTILCEEINRMIISRAVMAALFLTLESWTVKTWVPKIVYC